MPVQKIILPETLRVRSDGILEFTVKYESDDPTVTEFSSGLYFDSSVLEFVEVSNIFTNNIRLPNPASPSFPGDSRADESNFDSNLDTDQLFLTAWSDFIQNWPGVNNVDLYTIKFQVQNGVNLDKLILTKSGNSISFKSRFISQYLSR